ncbi:unnamed protein product [Adineta steineri]|uniref:Uncharacterized protein n=1 Tax=Adineta steineri TaxID=433720 RepID=A0A815LIA5_9BILA|nr:unnamed protein product [Adineta steineri]CAF3814132.1 unnamed protein product [Adineta steineri]
MAINLNNTTAIDSFIAGFNGTTQFNGASWKTSYPPVIRSGPVESHDLPFLNMALANKKNIDLPAFNEQHRLYQNRHSAKRLDAAKFSISCWVNISRLDFIEYEEFKSTDNAPKDLHWPEVKVAIKNTANVMTDELANAAFQRGRTSVNDGLTHIMNKEPGHSIKHLMG